MQNGKVDFESWNIDADTNLTHFPFVEEDIQFEMTHITPVDWGMFWDIYFYP